MKSETLKERADKALKIEEYKSSDVTDSCLLSLFEMKIYVKADELLQLIRDQQSRIEELEGKTRWKPIADMPEELKGGRWIFIKGNAYNGACVSWCDMEQMFHSQDMNWYGKDTITHYMEIPNE